MELGALLRAAREAAGISLRAMAERTYYSKAYLGLIETGQRPIAAAVVTAYENVLGSNLERLTAAAKSPASVDTNALADVAAMLAATRRIEDATGVVSVLPAVRGMSTMAEAFAREARTTARAQAASLASEIDQYQSWLEHAAGGDAAARRSLGKAVELAKEGRDSDRLTHSLTFGVYLAMARGDHAEGVALSEAARAVPDVHPVFRLYGHIQRGELLAMQGEARSADRELAEADAMATTADGIELPDSLYWYGEGFQAVHRGVVLSLLGRKTEAIREATQGVAAMPVEHRRTEWLSLMLSQVDPDMTADA
ncbi:helix-turn-helix domain-containing protein [Nocardia sp. Marseille-Q1738]